MLSGNRNFEGRIHPQVRANYLASPPLVVAYALTGRMDVDLTTEPLGRGSDGKPVYLKDIWPSDDEIDEVMARCVNDEMFKARYSDVFRGDDNWAKLTVPTSERYAWDPAVGVRQEAAVLRRACPRSRCRRSTSPARARSPCSAIR